VEKEKQQEEKKGSWGQKEQRRSYIVGRGVMSSPFRRRARRDGGGANTRGNVVV